jgi:DNA-binding NtrC family response regulator
MKSGQTDPTRAHLLLVDDLPPNLDLLIHMLEPEGYRILVASSGETALDVAHQELPDLILLDVLMPGIDGFETCRRLKRDASTRDIPVIFVTAKGETESTVEGFRAGGVDYITQPVEKEDVLVRVETHLKISRLTRELIQKNNALRQEMARRELAEEALQTADERLSLLSEQEAERWGIAGFIGESKTIARILGDIRRLHTAGTTSVLITGESGTGKELIARAIHFGGPRAMKLFLPVPCPAVPSDLAESLFFGHIRGAFTGANADRKGYFELADGGTLFLDEIGDMSLDLQAKLLRVLEDGSVLPLGARSEKHVDVRVVAATNVDLQTRMAEGRFRQDLYYRLCVLTVAVPPLRDHPEDIPLLTDHFLDLCATDMGMEAPELSTEALEALMAYSFPGNVRELKNVIQHALFASGGGTIQPTHLHLAHPERPPVPSFSGSPEMDGVGGEPPASETDDRMRRMVDGEETFWTVIHDPFLERELNRCQVKAVIQSGLEETYGSYSALLRLFRISKADYHKFMDFLRHHHLKPTPS